MPLLLVPRDPASTVADAKTTFTTWDGCMSKTYCKWPVIIGIVVGSLIILGVLFCVAQCVCCGAKMACCCFKCCCPSGRSPKSDHKRRKSDNAPLAHNPSTFASSVPSRTPMDTRPPNQQYRSHAAPAFNPVQQEAPQYARFDAHPKPVNEDALPAMPSWNDAKSHHVEEEIMPEKHSDVEMDHLHQNGSVAGTPMSGTTAVGTARRSPGSGRPPVNRIQTEDGYGFPNEYQDNSIASGNAPRTPRGPPGSYRSPRSPPQDPYNSTSPVQQPRMPGHRPGPGYTQGQQNIARSNSNYSQDQPYERRSPNSSHGQIQQYDRQSPGPTYAQMSPYDRRSPGPKYAPQQQYNQRSPDPSYRSPQSYDRRSPAPTYASQQPYAAHSPASPAPAYSALQRSHSGPSHQNPLPMPEPFAYSSPSPEHDPSPTPVLPPPSLMPGNMTSSARVAQTPSPSATAGAAYPGQQTYGAGADAGQSGQGAYRAFTPGW